MMVEPRIIDEAKSAYGKGDLVAEYILLLLEVLGCVAIKDLKRGVFGQANEAIASSADNIDLKDAVLLHRSAMLCFDRMLRERSIVRPKERFNNRNDFDDEKKFGDENRLDDRNKSDGKNVFNTGNLINDKIVLVNKNI
jgi:hypothetical protein